MNSSPVGCKLKLLSVIFAETDIISLANALLHVYSIYRQILVKGWVGLMSIPTSIDTLLSGSVVEWARIEFKESWDPKASLKTICAFANDIDNWGGGYLVLGVKSVNGQPVLPAAGIPASEIDRIMNDMLNKCKLISPEYLPIVEATEHHGKMFLIVWAPGGSSRPYSSPKYMAKGSKERVYYIRKMANTISPSEGELRDLFTLANNIPFDDRVNHSAEITDLNITLIQSYLKETNSSLYEDSKSMDFAELCKSMNIISILPEYTKPKNVGLMFFSFEPDKFFPYAQIDVVELPDGFGGDRIIENIFKGPLHNQLRAALLHIRNSIIQERVIKSPDVPEARRFFNYPFAAIEESLANAVYRKGYDEREPIKVSVLPDRIMIVSHPGADRSVSIDDLRNRRVFYSRYRNRRIGEILKDMHLTEGRNTGFRKILNALKDNGSPLPDFHTDENRLSFAVTIYQHPEFSANARDNIADGVRENVTEYVLDNVHDAGSHDIHVKKSIARRAEIVRIMEIDRYVTISRLALLLKVSAKTIQRDIEVLRNQGRIERFGSDSNGYWRAL